jgi:hypothetical protein
VLYPEPLDDHNKKGTGNENGTTPLIKHDLPEHCQNQKPQPNGPASAL